LPDLELDGDGLVKGYACPNCNGKLKPTHVDDVGEHWFKCEKCGESTSQSKLRASVAAVQRSVLPRLPLLPHSEKDTPRNSKVEGAARTRLRDTYGFFIRRFSKNYVLYDATFPESPDDVFTFKNLTSEKVKENLRKYTGAPTELIEGVLAELVSEASKDKNLKEHAERVQLVSPQEVKAEPLILDHLTMIENPAVADLPVIVEAVVSSTSISYLVPKTIEVFITDRNGVEYTKTIEIGEGNPVNIKFVGVNEDVKYRRLKRFVEEAVDERGTRIRIDQQKWRTIYKIRVRPPVFTLEKREGKIIDEKGFEYKSYDIYVCADKPITFEASSLMRLKGIVLPNPHSQNTTLLVYDVEFPEEFRIFNMENLEKLRNKFNGLRVQERVDWILSNFEKFSLIVGRRNLAFQGFLVFFTPTYIQLNGKVERGWGNAADVGDTTTGKSETLKKLIMLLKAGMIITAETASAVGLVGTATQSEKGQWTVEWGFLVLNDRKLLAIDGAHKLPFSQWAALSEAERSGVVTIAKAAKNSAYARTRQIKLANAVDREADKFSTKSMKSFLYPIQALSTVFDKTGIARLDLAVFADSRDVTAKEVNKQLDSNYDPDIELLADALRWCWSNTAKVQFTPEAVKEIFDAATALSLKFFADSVPLISIDMKYKLARLSAALAFMTVSTEDCKTVTVTQEHVKIIVTFLEKEYSNSGLNALAQEDKYETITQEDAELLIANITGQTGIDHDEVVEIIRFIVFQGRVIKEQLKNKFELVDKNQLRPLLATLESEKLLRVGKGFYPTAKLIELYKILPQQKIDPSLSECGKHGNRGKTILSGKNILRLSCLHPSEEGKCIACGQQTVLQFQVETDEGTHGFACADCAQRLKKENPEAEWLE
jgi:transcription initiation factor IIE alpha subunit